MSDKVEYTPLEDSASSHGGGEPRKPGLQQQHWTRLVGSFLLGVATMGLFGAIIQAFIIPPASHARVLPHAVEGSDPNTGLPKAWSHGDCGNSPEDAKARDCQYSIVLHSWLPKTCLTEADEQDAKAMYNNRTNWPYETQAGKNLTMEELALGDYHHFTTTFEWHVVHCMYVWKRLHRILLDPTQELDSYTVNYHHTSHCVKMIGGHPEGMKDSGTKIFVKYPKCAK